MVGGMRLQRRELAVLLRARSRLGRRTEELRAGMPRELLARRIP